jgi:1,4-alpha-glucan branching enzyme
MDPRARDVTHAGADGECIVDSASYDWQHGFQMPPWNELVIYEMHMATFPDNPCSKENLFAAATADLDHLADLGVNAVHILPMGEFPGDDSWGYNPAFPFAIESAYGRGADLKSFIDAAHSHGIAVIMDVVYNHFGQPDEGTWQFDPWIPQWEGQDMGGVYYYPDWRARTPWGAKNRPDYGRSEVRDFIRDNALMWLHEFRADGLRFDAVSFIRTVDGRDEAPGSPADLGSGWNLLKWIHDSIRSEIPWKLTIAEDLQNNSWVTKSTGEGGAGFASQWEAGFVHAIRDAVIAPFDEYRNLNAVAGSISFRYNGDPFQRVIYSESHDEAAHSNNKKRLVDAIAPGDAGGWHARKRSTLAMAVVMTSPGIPMIFQGQEINEWVPFGDRNRIDWTKLNTYRGIFLLHRDLIRLRRNWFNNTRGLGGQHVNVFHIGQDGVIAYHRWRDGGPGDDVVVILNFSVRTYTDYRIGLPREGQWHVRFNSDWTGYGPDFQDTPSFGPWAEGNGMHALGASGRLSLGPYTCLIISQ